MCVQRSPPAERFAKDKVNAATTKGNIINSQTTMQFINTLRNTSTPKLIWSAQYVSPGSTNAQSNELLTPQTSNVTKHKINADIKSLSTRQDTNRKRSLYTSNKKKLQAQSRCTKKYTKNIENQ